METRNIANELKKLALEIKNFVGGDIPKKDIDVFYTTFNTICDNLNKIEKTII